MNEHAHDYRKLNDEAVFCRGCGDIKQSAPPVCTLPHYQPTWVYYPPVYPTIVQPWTPNPWWTVTCGSTEIVTADSGIGAIYLTSTAGES